MISNTACLNSHLLGAFHPSPSEEKAASTIVVRPCLVVNQSYLGSCGWEHSEAAFV